MLILALDLGQFNKLAYGCLLDTDSGVIVEDKQPTTTDGILALIQKHKPEIVVYEPCSATGWVTDLCREQGVDFFVANVNHPAWQWRNRATKSDKKDARMLAQMYAMNQLDSVYIPSPSIREWRSFITYRSQLVHKRVSIQNHIGRILERHGIKHPRGKTDWSPAHREKISQHSKEISECSMDELWRGQLHIDLEVLAKLEQCIAEIEDKLKEIADKDKRVKLLQTIPGVGPRLSELVVATIDDPSRFKNGRHVASYAGLVPRRFQSGETIRNGRISKQGNTLLRTLLVEIGWISLMSNQWSKDTYQHLMGDAKKGGKRAIVAVARKLLIRCWAMLRDNTEWNPPELQPSTE